MTTHTVLDISELPSAEADHRSPIWWGNILLLVVETTMFGLLIACYFYFRQNFSEWPPPRVNETPILYKPMPNLDAGSVNMMLLFFSCLPMFWADRLCLRKSREQQEGAVKIALVLSILFGFLIAGIRFREFFAFHFLWNENAYASTVWLILGTHLLHIFTGTLENLLMLTWVMVKPLDTKHARDIRVTAIYWYWIVLIWVPFYVILYWSPHWL
jgi:heme/copper-type cytochrome/quinol oxidase subunit 3